MKITSGLFEAGIKCLTKCYLRSIGEPESGHAYVDWAKTKSDSYRRAAIKRLIAGTACNECISSLPSTEYLKTADWRLAVDVEAHTQNLEASIHALERIPAAGRGKPSQFIPIRFIFTNKLTSDEKCYCHLILS